MNPVEVEELLLGMGEFASKRAVSLVATWKALDARVGDAAPMSFDDAYRAALAAVVRGEGACADGGSRI